MSKKRTYREWAQKEKERNKRMYEELKKTWYCPFKECYKDSDIELKNPYYVKIYHNSRQRNKWDKKFQKRVVRKIKNFMPLKGNMYKKIYKGVLKKYDNDYLQWYWKR